MKGSKYVKLVILAFGLNLVAFSSSATLIAVDLSGSITQYEGQYHHGTHSVDVSTNTLSMTGNNWVALAGTYIISPNSVIQIAMNTTNVGEIHGIGFDINSVFDRKDDMTGKNFFQLAGSQVYGIQDYKSFASNGLQTFTIEVGKFFTGSFNNIIFVNDIDLYGKKTNSLYTYSVNLFDTDVAVIAEPSSLLLLSFGGLALLRRRLSSK